MNFDKAQTISKSVGEYNDCSVKAVAIATDSAYRVAHQAMRVFGNRRNGNGAYTHEINGAIEQLGFELEQVEVSAKTVLGLATDKAVRNGHFIAYTRNHVLAIKNGAVEDWTEGRRHRIIRVYKVTPLLSRKSRKLMAKHIFNL